MAQSSGKYAVRLYLKNGSVVEGYYSTGATNYADMLKEMYRTHSVTPFIRKGKQMNGVVYVFMRDVSAVEIYGT